MIPIYFLKNASTVLTSAILLGLCAQTFGYSYGPVLMGTEDTGAPGRYTPKHHILYYDRGYGETRHEAAALNKIKSSVSYLKSRKVPNSTILQFQNYTTNMATSNTFIARAIDAAYDVNYANWKACGGKRAAFINRLNPSRLTVYVVQSTWYSCGDGGCLYTAGETTFQNEVLAADVYVAGLLSDPTHGSLWTFSNVIAWEMGNWVAIQNGYYPQSLSQEIGSRSPCGLKATPIPSIPYISVQPVSASVKAGQTVRFVSGSNGGIPVPTVQWQVSKDGGKTFANIVGAKSTTYSFAANKNENAYQYRAVFTNSVGTASSQAAQLTVTAQ